MKHVVEPVPVVLVGVVRQFLTHLLAVDKHSDPERLVSADQLAEVGDELAGDALGIREVSVEDSRLHVRAGTTPAGVSLLKVSLRDLFEVEPELAGRLGYVPEEVAQFLGNPVLKPDMRVAVAKALLVLVQQLAHFAGETKEWHH